MSFDLKAYSKEIHKPVRKPAERRHVVVSGIDNTWAIDLADMSDLAADNDGEKWIMTVIDVFSRFAWAVPMKNKTAAASWEAFSVILSSGRKPEKLWSDKGKEFWNTTWTAHLKPLGVVQYSTFGEHKASTVERFNRTLKSKMWIYFTEHQTRNWVDELPTLMKDYNKTVHSSIGKSPQEASKKKNEKALLVDQAQEPEKDKPKLKLDDWVRISRVKGTFEKGYHPNWSFEIYRVVGIDPQKPVLYYLDDFYGEAVHGGFYEAEVQKTAQKDVFLVEKVERTRIVARKKEHLVKFVGYREPKWVSYSEMVGLGLRK